MDWVDKFLSMDIDLVCEKFEITLKEARELSFALSHWKEKHQKDYLEGFMEHSQ